MRGKKGFTLIDTGSESGVTSLDKGFTLIELLVVIAIIALLLAIMVPGLKLAKKKASTVVCMINTKNMSLGWYVYQNDNRGKIMSAQMDGVEPAGTYVGWIGTPRLATDTLSSSLTMSQTSPVSDENEIRGIEMGKLYPYIETPDVYHCVGDNIRKGPDNTRLFNSYASPYCLYAALNPSSKDYNQQIKKFAEIKSPASRYNFVESGETNRGNWIAGGWFRIAAPYYGHSGYGLWSPISYNHGDSSIFGFCDGHAEIYKWHDTDVLEHYNRTATGNSYNQFIPADQANMSDDIRYVMSGWPYRKD